MSDSEALSRLYRQLPAEEPSAVLDSQVLAAVNAEMVAAREQRARWQRRWRYQVPLATAATLVLAVALLLRQPDSQQELLERPQSDVQGATGYDMESAAGYGVESPADKDAAMAVEPATTAPLMSPPPPPAMSPPPPVAYVPYVPLPAVVAPIAVPTPMETSAPTTASAPAPEPVAMSVPVEAASAMPAPKQMPATARIAPMGIVADQALPQTALAKLLAEAAGMSAQEFCTRLQVLWASDTAAPACPTTDGQHQWPAPLAIVWQVNAGQVVRAEQPR